MRMVNEGGSIEVDGRGTLLAKKSSILNNNRNPGWTQADVEAYFRRYLGVTTFIWLDGTPGLEITDDHIDGSARFAKGNIIVTHARKDFTKRTDYDKLVQAKDAKGASYKIVILPLTARNAPGTNYKGLYINYYVGNTAVIVPSYNDPNDVVAANVLKNLYPEKKIVQINFTELYKDGGIVHCVTMHQPAQ